MKFNSIVFSVSIAMFLFLSMGMGRKVDHFYQSNKNGVDTIFQNDSMFSIITYEDGAIRKIELMQFVDSKKEKAYDVQNVVFGKDGRLARFYAITGDTISSDKEIEYEQQLISFDQNRLSSIT